MVVEVKQLLLNLANGATASSIKVDVCKRKWVNVGAQRCDDKLFMRPTDWDTLAKNVLSQTALCHVMLVISQN